MLISICIPTLNRTNYLKQALESIFAYSEGKNYFEICISNNNSEEDYSGIEELIYNKKLENWNIKYIIQNKRLDIDHHMHYVVEMASCDYCYLLGDDDFFISNELLKLVKLVLNNNIDLAIFNGKVIDANNCFIKNHFNLPSKTYDSVEFAFKELRDKGTFGSILVKKKHLNKYYFNLLYGSSHAYGCYWLSILNDYYNEAKIIIPNFQCVCLRSSEKNYNLAKVYYRDIPFELSLYNRWLNIGKPLSLHVVFESKINIKIKSLSFLAYMIFKGTKLDDIQQYNPKIVKNIAFKFKYFIALFLVNTNIFKLLLKIRNSKLNNISFQKSEKK